MKVLLCLQQDSSGKSPEYIRVYAATFGEKNEKKFVTNSARAGGIVLLYKLLFAVMVTSIIIRIMMGLAVLTGSAFLPHCYHYFEDILASLVKFCIIFVVECPSVEVRFALLKERLKAFRILRELRAAFVIARVSCAICDSEDSAHAPMEQPFGSLRLPASVLIQVAQQVLGASDSRASFDTTRLTIPHASASVA